MRRIYKSTSMVGLALWMTIHIAAAQTAQPGPRPRLTCTQLADLDMKAAQLPSFKVTGQREGEGPLLAIVGLSVPIDGSKSQVRMYYEDCPQKRLVTRTVPHFAWTLERPPGSRATLENADSLKVSFKPDIPGDYMAHLVGCPTDAISTKVCKFQFNDSTRVVHLLPSETTVKVTVSLGGQLPPLFTPGNLNDRSQPPPTAPQHYEKARGFCGSDIGVAVWRDPEWYTTKSWATPTPPYELAEGRVYSSHIAGADVLFTHVANDHNANLELDPPYRRLLVDDTPEDKSALLPFGGLEIEWEFLDYAEAFRPIEGDRMSVLGYHVLDCGHSDPGTHTEIHPPIAVAVHRPRAVKLPERFQYAEKDGQPLGPPQPIGSNVYVPGIVTDVWVNLDGGEMLRGVKAGLHQPTRETQAGWLGSITPSVRQPTTAGVDFTFNVYLPPSPTYLLREVMSPPFDPALFVQIQDHPLAADLGASTRLTIREIERHLDGPWPYLRYRIDLSPLSPGERFAKRIVAAWVYPDVTGQNFGLHAYRVRLEQMKILDTGNFSSGNWKLWATLPSVEMPWTKLIDCSSCIEATSYVPGANIWKRGAMDAVGHLLGEVLVFQPAGVRVPSQTALLRLTGYDQDWEDSDGIGVYLGPASELGRQNISRLCDDCPNLSLDYSIETGTTPVAESLDPTAKAFFQALLVHPAAVDAIAKPIEGDLYLSTMTAITAQRQKVLFKSHTDETKESKKFLEPTNLRDSLQTLSAAEQEDFVKDVRKRMLYFLGSSPSAKNRQKVAMDLQRMKGAIPAELFKKYLCDLQTGKPCR